MPSKKEVKPSFEAEFERYFAPLPLGSLHPDSIGATADQNFAALDAIIRQLIARIKRLEAERKPDMPGKLDAAVRHLKVDSTGQVPVANLEAAIQRLKADR